METSEIISKVQLVEQLKSSDVSHQFYQYYPRLFSAYFEGLDPDLISELSDAGYLYYQSTLMLDSLIDDNNFSFLTKALSLQEESIKILTSIFGIDATFWGLWNQRKIEFFDAVKFEKKLYSEAEVSYESYCELAEKKAAFGKIAIDCLWILSGEKSYKVYEQLMESHKNFSIGLQLCDDINDFKEDLINRQFNWGVYTLAQNQIIDSQLSDFSTQNKLFYIKGIAQQLFELAINHFEMALNTIDSISAAGEWRDIVFQTQKSASKDLDILVHYLNSIRNKLEESNTTYALSFINYSTISNIQIKRGLEFVEKQFCDNYPDLKHRMFLGSLDGFENSSQIHESDIFPRAMLNDCLFSVSSKYNLEIKAFLVQECEYLIENRNKDEIGGWSYFPSVNEIAADIDDLAQIMQLFLHVDRPDLVNEYCVYPLTIALTERTSEDGGIETWIIPNHNLSDLQKKQDYFNQTRWGRGPDVEVVANLVYALYLYDYEKYQHQISKSIDYILKHQKTEGTWESTWYHGDYYGTYACLRLLSLFGSMYTIAINRSIRFLESNQNIDGGFGLSPKHSSDPLSTSFALMAYSQISPVKNLVMKKAIEFISSCQQNDGGWQEVDFIKPKLLSPFKSRSLTTGFVLKALSQF
jgi:squalene-hopene/tetraprenyl-beta-curcumene cyclase